MFAEADGLSRDSLAKAESARARAAAAGGWFSGYLVALGVVSAAEIVLLETVLSEGFARYLVIGGWMACLLLASWWSEQRSVFPARASRYQLWAMGLWFTPYLLVVGPLVRWQFGTSLMPWVLTAVGLSLPFFVAAGLAKRRQ